jgi:hypothetical protein
VRTRLGYRVRAYNGSGSSDFCEPVHVTTPPPYLMLTVTTADTVEPTRRCSADPASDPPGTACRLGRRLFYDDGSPGPS